MPTVGGWRLLAVGVAAVVSGRAVGMPELYVVGAAAMAAVVLALAVRLLHPSRLEIRRRTAMPLVAAGEQARLTVDVVNRARLRSSTVQVRDRVSGSRDVGLVLAPLAGGEAVSGNYRLETTRRGVLEIGPMLVDDIDGLSLARRRRRVDSRVRVIVHPPVENLPPRRVPAGDELSAPAEFRKRSLGMESDEFDILRPYVSGDDPRRIHWPTTARFDELMVRRFRASRPGRLTAVIDTRPPGDLVGMQDRTTSVVASIVSSVLRGGDEARIVTTDGRGTPVLSHYTQFGAALEFLALMSGGRSEIDVSVPADGSAIVVVSASPTMVEDEDARIRLARHLQASLVVTYGSRPSPGHTAAPPSSGWIHLSGPGQLAHMWQPSVMAGHGGFVK